MRAAHLDESLQLGDGDQGAAIGRLAVLEVERHLDWKLGRASDEQIAARQVRLRSFGDRHSIAERSLTVAMIREKLVKGACEVRPYFGSVANVLQYHNVGRLLCQ